MLVNKRESSENFCRKTRTLTAYKQVAAIFGHRKSRVKWIQSQNELVDLYFLERNHDHCI